MKNIFLLSFFLLASSLFPLMAQDQSKYHNQEKLAFQNSSLPHYWQTNAVFIMKGEDIVFERYENGFHKERPHRLWSIAKSLSSLLIGMRLEDLGLTPEHKIINELPQLKGLFREEITVRNLLQMSSGLKWNEFYEENPFQSDVLKMLYSQKDMGQFAAQKVSITAPGTHFHYSSGDTNLLMKWFKKTFKSATKEHDTYPEKRLFAPLGIEDATWEQDRSGTFIGSSYAYMSPRSLAKIGRLILNKGAWKDSLLIKENYLKDSFKVAPALCQTKLSENISYGYHWWLNQACPGRERELENVSSRIVMALGHHGQILVLFPQLDAVAIRFGLDKELEFPRKEWIEIMEKELKKSESDLGDNNEIN